MQRKFIYLLTSLLIMFFLFGCGVSDTRYKQPTLNPPKKFLSSAPFHTVNPRSNDFLKNWWQGYEDKNLEETIAKVLLDNHQIKAAKTVVAQYQSGLKKITAEGALQVEGSSRLDRNDERDLDSRDKDTSSSLSIGPDLAYTLDIFGHQKVKNASAKAALRAAQEQLDIIIKKKRYETIQNYLQIKGKQEELHLLEKIKGFRKNTFALTQEKFDLGLASKLDVQRAQSLINSLHVEIIEIKEEIRDLQHTLANLAGLYMYTPKSLLFGNKEKLLDYKSDIKKTVPFDVITNRSDVKKAQVNLEKSTYDIGIAKAELYPVLQLGASFSISAEGIIGGSVTQLIASTLNSVIKKTLSDGGAINADIAQKEASAQEALQNYKDTLKTAINEVQKTLDKLQSSKEKQKELLSLLTIEEKNFYLAQTLFEEGLTNFIDVIDTQRELTQTQKELLREKLFYELLVSKYFYFIGG